jgi:mRNA interferase MazF
MPTYDIAEAKQWDVVVLPFPYSDRFAEKRRPALVISDDNLHRQYQVLWVVMITSVKINSWACDVAVSDLAAAGLTVASVIRPAKIACLEANRVLRRAGQLTVVDARRVRAELKQLLKLG